MSCPFAQQRYVDWAHRVIIAEGDRGLRVAWMFALAMRAIGEDIYCETIVYGLLLGEAARNDR